MVVCPSGHDSASEDYCDVCGMLMSAPSAPSAVVPEAVAPPAAAACPQCGAPKSGQFCESCGFNFTNGQAPAPSVTPDLSATWTAVVGADRGYYDRVREASGPDADDIPFPAYCPERRFQLTGNEVQIGRRSPSRGLNPAIDLTGPPLDPGISRLHAVLMTTPDGGWAVIDPGSANGTELNGAEVPIGQQTPLNDGDRITLGAWTVITIHQR
jgi:hypothetical protein